MYLHHTIVPGGLVNVIDTHGAAIGFRLQVRIGFPRGMPLSMVEGFDVVVDDGAIEVGPEQVLFRLRGSTHRSVDLIDMVGIRWEMGEVAELIVVHPGGLTTSEHRVTVTQCLRVGPTPEPAKTVGSRTVDMSADPIPAADLQIPAGTTPQGAQR